MKLDLGLSVLAAAMLAACSAPAPSAAPPSTAPAAEDVDDQGRPIRGSIIKLGQGPSEPSVPINLDQPVTPGSGVTASTGPSVTVSIAGDTLTTDRMGYYNALALDANPSTNANAGNDFHLVLWANNFPAGATATKFTVASSRPGWVWDSIGFGSHAFVGVYSTDNATLMLKPGGNGQWVQLDGNPVFNLYVDGLKDGPNGTLGSELQAGDVLTVTLTTNTGESVWPNLRI